MKAVKLDNQLCDSQLALALIQLFRYHDIEKAGSYIRRALSIKPHSLKAKFVQAQLLNLKGKHKTAIRLLEEAVQSHPLSQYINTDLARSYLYADQPEKALEQFNKILELDAEFYPAVEGKGWALAALQKYEQALEQFEDLHQLAGDKFKAVSPLGYVQGKLGNREEAEKQLELLEQRQQKEKESFLHLDFALVYLGMADHDRVFDHLRQAAEERMGAILFLNIHPVWSELKSDARFDALIELIGLPKGKTKQHPA